MADQPNTDPKTPDTEADDLRTIAAGSRTEPKPLSPVPSPGLPPECATLDASRAALDAPPATLVIPVSVTGLEGLANRFCQIDGPVKAVEWVAPGKDGDGARDPAGGWAGAGVEYAAHRSLMGRLKEACPFDLSKALNAEQEAFARKAWDRVRSEFYGEHYPFDFADGPKVEAVIEADRRSPGALGEGDPKDHAAHLFRLFPIEAVRSLVRAAHRRDLAQSDPAIREWLDTVMGEAERLDIARTKAQGHFPTMPVLQDIMFGVISGQPPSSDGRAPTDADGCDRPEPAPLPFDEPIESAWPIPAPDIPAAIVAAFQAGWEARQDMRHEADAWRRFAAAYQHAANGPRVTITVPVAMPPIFKLDR